MGAEEVVSLRKWAGAEEAVMRRERRRVGGFKNEMLRLVDERLFRAGVAAPKNEDEMRASLV